MRAALEDKQRTRASLPKLRVGRRIGGPAPEDLLGFGRDKRLACDAAALALGVLSKHVLSIRLVQPEKCTPQRGGDRVVDVLRDMLGQPVQLVG